jgi:hypothetical protein
MGYRSEVESMIYGEAEKIDLFIVKHKILDTSAFTEFKDDITIKVHEGAEGVIPIKAIILSGHGWKWYDSYGDVKAWMELLKDAEDFGLMYEHVRVGEEDGDIESDCSEENEGWLEVYTEISNQF